MLKRYYLLILTLFVTTACIHRESSLPPPVLPNMVPHVIKQYRPVTPFTQVDVQGRINVTLHTGYKKPRVLLTGDIRDLVQVRTIINEGILFVSLGKGYPRYGEVHVDIRGTFLNVLRYKGTGLIIGKQLHTRYLELYLANQGTTRLGGTIGLQKLEVVGNGLVQIDGVQSYDLQVSLIGNPKVRLNGFVSLAKLDIDGNAWLSLYWLRSDNLTIRAKKDAKIQLAGIVNRLDLELWGNAQFKGRYLRAQRSFVKTHDKSSAEIYSLNHQSNLATDASDIYYYNLPATRADFMAFNGSVLDMREWSQYDLEDFTRYNHQFP